MHLTCANPQCGAPLYPFAGGKLKAVPLPGSASTMFVWMCNDCLNEDAALGFDTDFSLAGPRVVYADGAV
jgi:hypothetical protein